MEGDRGVTAGIQHVALEIAADEVERAREFWGLVGFDEVAPPASLSERAIWMAAGPAAARTQIHLLRVERDSEVRSRQEEVGCGGHVAIVVPGFEAAVSALRQAGFSVEDRRAHWGAARAFATHPGGHTIELMAAPPPN